MVASRIQQGGAAYARQLADPASRTRQGISVLSQTATREANILAYNDVFLLIAVLATVLAAWIFGRALWLKYVAPPVPPAPPPAQETVTDSPIATAAGTPPEPMPAQPVNPPIIPAR
jgi:hypothetical protein